MLATARRRTRRLDRAERATVALGAASLVAAAALLAAEARHLRRSRRAGGAQEPTLISEATEAARHAVDEGRQVVEQARAGLEVIPARDVTVFNFTAAFLASSALARAIAYRLRSRRTCGPFRDLQVGGGHIHHFVPGVALLAATGTAALLTDSPQARSKLAILFGGGLGLVIDESALLLRLDDVYWSRDGLIGFQLTYGTLAVVTVAGFVRRLRRAAEATAA